MVGIASKKLNRDAVWLSKPKKRAAEIVMPDLEVPGIRDNDWNSPITNASIDDISDKSFFVWDLKVAKYKTIAKKIVVKAIIRLVLK